MKTILWSQNEEVQIPDTFVINGKINESNDSMDFAFSELNKANSNLAISPKTRKRLHEKFGTSEQLNFSINRNRYYIQGTFLETDNRGRNMPYMFLANDCNSIDLAIDLLQQNAILVNRHCKDIDLKFIRIFSNKKYLLIIIFILGICSLIALLWKITR